MRRRNASRNEENIKQHPLQNSRTYPRCAASPDGAFKFDGLYNRFACFYTSESLFCFHDFPQFFSLIFVARVVDTFLHRFWLIFVWFLYYLVNWIDVYCNCVIIDHRVQVKNYLVARDYLVKQKATHLI